MIKLFEKKEPEKNYIIVLIVSIITIIVPLYVSRIYLNNKNDLFNKSIFEEEDSRVSQINFSDLDFVVSESNDVVLYVSFYNSSIKSMERKLYREISKNDLFDKIIYLNVNNNPNYLEDLKNKFPNIASEISDAPLMIYIKDGEGVFAVNSEFKMVDYEVFEKLLRKYEEVE